MCGIVGAIAQRNVTHILLEGLKRLEYRGYDSAGIAVFDNKDHSIHRLRTLGKVSHLEEALQKTPLPGFLGIAHTRWATHGEPSVNNAHPHFSHEQIAIVHNGIIENHEELKEKLIKQGYQFESETDTEIVAHLIHACLKEEKNLLNALHCVRQELKGAYALGIIDSQTPDALYAVRSGSPLVIGLGIDENFIGSDPIALLPVTQRFIYLEEGDIACVKKESISIYDQQFKSVDRKIHVSNLKLDAASKNGFRHYMQKEIYDQPEAILDTLEGQIQTDKISDYCFGWKASKIFPQVKRVLLVACGTSYHAALVGRYWIESIASIPCTVEIASENRYREQVIEPNTLFVALSQSGETADTLAAFRQAKNKGFLAALGICNVAGSSLAREADLLFITKAGTEIGVAATKTFTCQLVALLLLTLSLKQKFSTELRQQILHLPTLAKETLKLDVAIEKLSYDFRHKEHALFLGRSFLFPIASEGALKLKEISYVHAEAYPAGELKHGPLALVENNMPVIVLAPQNVLFDKIESNIKEVQARSGDLMIFTDSEKYQDNPSFKVISMPKAPEILTPIIYSIPMQILAYHVAVLKGTDVDQPRNLAKSVTVE